MHYVLQALDWLETLTHALGAGISLWAFRRCRKAGYLVVGLYSCLALFSLLVLPHFKAELSARRAPTPTEEMQRKISTAISEAYERILHEEGVQPAPAERSLRVPLGPMLLVLGIWLLARRDLRICRNAAASDAPKDQASPG